MHNHSHGHSHSITSGGKLMKLSTAIAIAVALSLMFIKIIGYYLTDSVAIFSSMLDSAQDAVISLVNLFALRYSLKPADNEHRFGHGKAEDLAALSQGILLMIIAALIGAEAMQRFYKPVPINDNDIGIVIMLIALVATIGLVLFQRHVIRKTNSTLVAADSLHYVSDILSNIAVIVSLVIVSQFGLIWIDSVMGLAIAAYIFWGALKVFLGSSNNLMDKEFDDATRAQIEEIIIAHPEVKRVKNLRTRSSGIKQLIQFEFTMDGATSLKQSDIVAHQIEAKLLAQFPHAEIFMHQEPDE